MSAQERAKDVQWLLIAHLVKTNQRQIKIESRGITGHVNKCYNVLDSKEPKNYGPCTYKLKLI